MRRFGLVLLGLCFLTALAGAGPVREKSLQKALWLSGLVPGAGEFYIGKPLKGLRHIGTELPFLGLTVLCVVGGANATEDSTRIGAFAGAGLCAMGFGMFKAFNLIELHDDVVAWNYRARLVESGLKIEPGPKRLRVGWAFGI